MGKILKFQKPEEKEREPLITKNSLEQWDYLEYQRKSTLTVEILGLGNTGMDTFAKIGIRIVRYILKILKTEIGEREILVMFCEDGRRIKHVICIE